MALTLNGSTRWPGSKDLQRLGETRASMAPARVRQTFERITEAVADTTAEVRTYIAEHSSFRAIGERMLEAWGQGCATIG